MITLFGWLREIGARSASRGNRNRRSTPAQRFVAARPHLEQLEDRLTPAPMDTVTNVAVSIAPNTSAGTATETITATVNLTSGGTANAGSVFFNLNNATGTVTLVSTGSQAGTATFTTTLPLFAVAIPQTLEVSYLGDGSLYQPSNFVSPVYLNVVNAIFASTITFTGPQVSNTTLPINSYGSANGETDDVPVFGIPLDFNYVDPGTIQTFKVFGMTVPGSQTPQVFTAFQSYAISHINQIL